MQLLLSLTTVFIFPFENLLGVIFAYMKKRRLRVDSFAVCTCYTTPLHATEIKYFKCFVLYCGSEGALSIVSIQIIILQNAFMEINYRISVVSVLVRYLE